MSKEFNPDDYLEQMQEAQEGEDDLERKARERSTSRAQKAVKEGKKQPPRR